MLKGVAMERREFLKMGTAAGLVSSAKMLEPLAQAEQAGSGAKRIPKRKLGKTGEELSIIGFADIVVMENSPSFASNIIAEAVDRGINYFDVAPTYGLSLIHICVHPLKTEWVIQDASRKEEGAEIDCRFHAA